MSDPLPVRASHAVREFGLLPEGMRARLRVPEDVVHLWDLVVVASEALIHGDDTRPWVDRLGDALETRSDLLVPQRLEALAARLSELSQADGDIGSVTSITNVNYIKFFERSVGSATFHRLRQGLLDDVQVVAEAVRRGAALLMPYAMALEDALSMVTSSDRPSAVAAFNPAERSLISLLVQADRRLGGLAAGEFEGDLLSGIFGAGDTIAPEDLLHIIEGLRSSVFSKSLDIANSLGEVASRKLRGARDALAASSDGVSQASSSLIELIDRLLRSAFTDGEVLQWIAENARGTADLTYVRNGKVLPSKRGQALCFVAAGQPMSDEQAPLFDVLADVVVSVRRDLQSLKHADEGSPDEVDRVVALSSALQGFFLLAVGVGWRGMPDEPVSRMLERFKPVRPTSADAVEGGKYEAESA